MENKKSKSLLVKLLSVACALCCCLSLVFGLAGCATEEVKTVQSTAINAKGELVITYSDGSVETLGVTTLGTGCAHDMSEVIITHATCVNEEVKASFCTKCNGYKLTVGEKNAELHGKFEQKLNGNVMQLELVQNLGADERSAFEIANNACEKRKCLDCNQYVKQHAETAWRPVDEVGVLVCEQEHLEIETCVKCNAAVSDVRVAGAKGHTYDKTAHVKSGDNYIVTLTCTTCAKVITATAKLVDEQVATCKEGGYKEYEYTYNNYLEDITATFKPVEEIVGKSANHVLVEGLIFTNGGTFEYTPANAEKLNAAFAAGTIRWTVGEPANCATHNMAGYNCADCGELVVINLSGEHEFNEAVKPTCTVDGYASCKNCTYVAAGDKAEGHKYTYVADSFDAATMTIDVKCGACEGVVADVAVAKTSEYAAKDCKDQSYTIYTTTTLTNGLATGHANYALAKVTAKVMAAEQHAHKIGELKFINGATYEYTEAIGAAIAAGKIRWTVGEPANCSEYKIAGYDCEDCKQLVAIYLSGEHTLNGIDVVAGPFCETRGITTQLCTACGKAIEVASADAKGHTFVIDAADKAAFEAAPSTTMNVTFTCACGKSIELKAAKTTKQESDGCVTIDKTIYTFTYEYQVESAIVGAPKIDKEFTYTYTVDKSTGAHQIGTLKLQNGGTYEYNDTYAELIAAGKIRWTVGEPANCSEHNMAGFDCEKCKELVVIFLSGAHELDAVDAIIVKPDCENDGETYKICADCGTKVVLETSDALGHEIVYTVNGATALTAGEAVGTCTRQGCNKTITVVGTSAEYVAETCGTDGKRVWKYVGADGKEVAERKEFVLPRTGLHTLSGIQVEFVEGGYKYVCELCSVCKSYVVISKVAA